MLHLILQLVETGGDDDGVVDVRAHLDGADDEVAHEVEVGPHEIREREVDPDSALDDHDEQDGHTDGLEGEQQHQQDDKDGHDVDDDIVDGEGLLEIVLVGGVTGHVEFAVRVILPGDGADGVGELISSLAGFQRGAQVDEDAVVVVALQLGQCALHLVAGVVEVVQVFLREGDDAGVGLVADVEEHIHQRHFIGGEVADDLAVLLVLDGVGGVDHLGGLVVQVGHLGELAGGELVFQHIAVLGLDVGQTLGGVYLIIAFQLLQHLFLDAVIVALGVDEGHEVRLGEVFFDHLVRDEGFVHLRHLDDIVAVGVGTKVREVVTDEDDHQEDDRDDLAGAPCKAAHEGDLRHEVPVLGLIHVGSEEHQQAGHDHEHREHRKEDGLDEADGHIRADAELHEQHSHKAADGGQGAGADLGDALAQGLDDGLLQRHGLVFFLEVVAEDDGVVQRQRQLQDVRDRVGHERDGAEHEVCTHVQDHAHHEGEDEDRHLGVGLGRQEQDDDDDDGNVHHDDPHLGINGLLLGVAQRGGDVDVVVGEVFLHPVEGLEALVIVLGVVEGDGVKGRHRVLIIMVGGVVVVQHLDALELGEPVGKLIGLSGRDVGHHDIGRAVGRELLVHDVEAHAGLRGLGQVGGHVGLDLDPPHREHREDGSQNDKQEHKVAAFHDLARKLVHEVYLWFFVFVQSVRPPLS